MAVTEKEQVQIDERVTEILNGLAVGKTREELADGFGYSNWKSVDMHMRRRNFTWDGRQQTYVPKAKPQPEFEPVDYSKAGKVIALLEKEGDDPRRVAQKMGFKGHRELATYMATKGYEWDSIVSNYVKRTGVKEQEEEKEVAQTQRLSGQKNQQKEGNEPLIPSNDVLGSYLPLLNFLQQHQEQLMELVIPSTSRAKIPRYALPGIGKTKTVQMMNTLEQLVVDFSREKNISQRELFEVALIEFFTKYGYQEEVERLLST